MTYGKLFRAGSIATAMLAMSTVAALAFVPFNIEVVRNGNVYANRTNTAFVVNHIKKGDTVKVTQVKVSWCYIQLSGDDGWVHCNDLAPFN